MAYAIMEMNSSTKGSSAILLRGFPIEIYISTEHMFQLIPVAGMPSL